MYYPCFYAQWRIARGAGALERKPWGRINTLFSHLKMRNLDQTMPNKCVFFEKTVKSPYRRGPPPNLHWPPAAGGSAARSLYCFQ